MLIYLLITFFICILLMQIFSISKEGFGDTTSLADGLTESPIATTSLSPITATTSLRPFASLSPSPYTYNTTASPIDSTTVTDETTVNNSTMAPAPTPAQTVAVMAPVTGPSMDPSIPSRVTTLEKQVSEMSAQVNVLAASSNQKYTNIANSYATTPPSS